MAKNELVEAIINSYQEIGIILKVEDMLRFSDIDNRLTIFDKDRILEELCVLGYDFDYKKSTKEFSFEECSGDFTFKLSLNINGGIVLPYIYVYHEGKKVPFDYPNLIFTYKFFKKDFESLLSPGTVYTNYNDFSEIMGHILAIYEEFKLAFLNRIESLGFV